MWFQSWKHLFLVQTKPFPLINQQKIIPRLIANSGAELRYRNIYSWLEMLRLQAYMSSVHFISFTLCSIAWLSRPQRLGAFWFEHQGLQPLWRSNTGSPWFTELQPLYTCSESNLTCRQEYEMITDCVCSEKWTFPNVAILGADLL